MLRFTPLASGSKGNCGVVQWPGGALLIDCGLPYNKLKAALAANGTPPESLNAIIVTHEHSDHVVGLKNFTKRHSVPVYLSPATAHALYGEHTHATFIHLQPNLPLTLDGLEIHPFPVPHDARQAMSLTFRQQGHPTPQLGLLTDCGHITPHVLRQLDGCTALALEANHCPQMLAKGPYPPYLKRRVGGGWGHLPNEAAAKVAAHLAPTLQHLCLVHLSEKNNTPQKALDVVGASIGAHVRLYAAGQHAPAPALEVPWA